MKMLSYVALVASLVLVAHLGLTTSVGRVSARYIDDQVAKRSLCNTFGGCQSRPAMLTRKRSLCNTFGGCGSKRSTLHSGMEEFVDDRRPIGMDSSDGVSGTLADIGDIIDEIVQHLRSDRNYILKYGTNDSKAGKQVAGDDVGGGEPFSKDARYSDKTISAY